MIDGIPPKEMKRPRRQSRAFQTLKSCCKSAGDRVGRARALLALADREVDLLTFVERRVALGPDFGVVDEQIVAAIIRSDESVSLVCVEPFYRACTHLLFSLGPPGL